MRMSRHAPDCLSKFKFKQNKNLVPFTWIEHVASPLPRECSTTELKGHTCCPMPHVLRHVQLETGAGEGNRTLVISLEGFSSTIELHPQGRLPQPHKKSFSTANHLFSCGGGGWIRTSVLVRGQIYSLLPLTTRPPLRREPQTIFETKPFVNRKVV
jgi:hypothetical protein